ncbi:hypothetical protein F6S92_05805 [Bifidobacterium dentium]|jgi:hypothetical protein|uniref:Uncharacterized protein n=1 Tax=Bifidobacterium dentium ATCC 27679 TaxID=871562 RepID=E0Q6I5_9BIFI|nr:hypothetical protein HMPREF0168_0743 [Bifidobacterium dentium ATCC 27679]NEG53174.1 hypothetical protein [Bifidobacterium dentium]TFZ20530.1 hypothetical protein E4U07_10160 [Bifidobacterium dentium]DAH86020.1 MAG TPA: hypothetical protein [Caudoviricetes sp.]HBJ52411.1 hypothetical protein [Bifidobacterium dentium]
MATNATKTAEQMASIALPCLRVPNTVTSEMTANTMDTSTKIEQKNLASTGLPNASGMEITANTIAVIALLEMGFFVELLTLLIRTILLLQFDILCIGS